MGSRGARTGISESNYIYGTEYTSVYQSGNIKFLKYNLSSAATAPMETMTRGRVYATIDSQDRVKYITYFDKNNKRYKQIDVIGRPHTVNNERIIPHTHKGYNHDEKGTYSLSNKESKMVDRVLTTWENRNK
ncbi:hypothetical protein [Fastidiosipila sanguinis]|uniref:Bacterial toxin 24 domain-containing protein n=1 Tax=Fastidiosipila sanguinis TaxID=236753 RepID=A0A2S0KP66_9FIRM|nr:hypothetical protein [Fastidiosipila sanguinis]AVM42832.1 hypothetical protein C5Q98_06235 [Fastidiosipila sanguinis]